MLKPTFKSIDLALTTLLNFVKVARPDAKKDFTKAKEKIYLFSESAGLDSDTAAYLMEEIGDRLQTDNVGPMYLGVCIGLLMADHAYELQKKEDRLI